MTSPARMNALQVAYDNRSDPRLEDRSDEAIEAIAGEIERDLLANGSNDCDDERLQLNLDCDAMRKAYHLCKAGGRDAALCAFMRLFEAAAEKAANDEAPDVYARRCRETEQEAAADRHDRRFGG